MEYRSKWERKLKRKSESIKEKKKRDERREKQKTISLKNKNCERCGKSATVRHHKFRNTNKIVLLCNDCHNSKHF